MNSRDVSCWHNQLGRQRCSVASLQPETQVPCLILARFGNFDASCSKNAVFEHHRARLEDGHWSPPNGYQSSTSTDDALDEESSLEGAVWDKF